MKMSELKSERLQSIDVFRGITIVGMILVNNIGDYKHNFSIFEHADWNGCTPTDLIFPFFLFIMGVSTVFSISGKIKKGEGKQKIILHLIKRTLILFALGVFLNGFPHFYFPNIRIPGVLQRIALVNLFAGLIFLYFSRRGIAILSVLFLLAYWIIMTFVPVPGFGEPNFEKTSNFAAWLDNYLLPGHLWAATKVWDPEGFLSTIPAIVTGLIGLLTGYLVKEQKPVYEKVTMLFIYGNILIVAGAFWGLSFPINKSLWTSSYVLYTGGIAISLLAFCVWLIDIKKSDSWTKPFMYFSMNAITAYFLSSLLGSILWSIKFDTGLPKKMSLRVYLYDHLFHPFFNDYFASLLWPFVYILIWYVLVRWMYKKKIFVKI